jgi:hypothetical protein
LKIRLFFLKKIDFPDALIQDVKKIDVKILFIIEFQKWVYGGFKNVGVFTIFSAFLFTLENQGVLP